MPSFNYATPEDRLRFALIVEQTLKNEGGFYDNKVTGEIVNFGITLKFLKTIRPTATRNDIVKLTMDGAKALYYPSFWGVPGIWRLNDNALAFRVFDLGVNNGTQTAIRLLQRALNSLGDILGVDGSLGALTADAANRRDPKAVIAALRQQAAARYKLLAKDPIHAANLKGWLARLETDFHAASA